jgi:hypothetical protein
MTTSTPKPLHIFKPGNQTAMSGVTLAFSESDLADSARAYDPAKHEAPIVIGHPRHDAPAYGWVKSLSCTNEGLNAEPHQVDADFAELVATGRYKKISASFYLPDAANNPVPGVYYLRHVGFLGAQPPAVKGLKQAEFADAEDGVVEFGDWGMDTNASSGVACVNGCCPNLTRRPLIKWFRTGKSNLSALLHVLMTTTPAAPHLLTLAAQL